MSESDSDAFSSGGDDVIEGKSENVQYIMGVAPMTVEEAASALDKILVAVRDEEFAAFRKVALAMFDTKQLEVDVARQQKAATQHKADKTKPKLKPSPIKLIKTREKGRLDTSGLYQTLDDVETKDGIVIRRLQCQQCTHIFSFKHQLLRHVRSKHGFQKDRTIRIRKKAHERKFLCDLCPGRYTTELRLRAHKATVHVDTPGYRCAECPATFKELRRYQAHMMYHNKDYPIPCSHCSCRFPSLQSLKSHEFHYHKSKRTTASVSRSVV